MGEIIGSGALAIATDLAKGVGGILGLVTLISGIVMLTGVGGNQVGKFVRSYIVQTAIGCLFCGGYLVIAGFMTKTFGGA